MSFRRRNIEITASSGSLRSAAATAAAIGEKAKENEDGKDILTFSSPQAPAPSGKASRASAVKGRKLPAGTTTDSYAISDETASATPKPSVAPGIRASPVDGRATTSTGTPSLDAVLAGHGGLPIGNSMLIEESGTTDYAGVLLRYYAAEGILQEHKVHVLGAGELWTRELPGLSTGQDTKKVGSGEKSEKMKIAWRYERLGDFGSVASGRDGPTKHSQNQPTPLTEKAPYCHSFDLTKRLAFPVGISIDYMPVSHQPNQISPFQPAIESLSKSLSSSPPKQVHRLVIPSLLSPTFYPYHASSPPFILQFLHSLRGLLRKYPTQLTAMINFPVELYVRSSALVRWIELLSDGVIELSPFLYQNDAAGMAATSAAATAKEEPPHGLIKIHRLPVLQERGGGRFSLGEDLAFVASRRTFTIKPFHLPPVDGEDEGSGRSNDANSMHGTTSEAKENLEF